MQYIIIFYNNALTITGNDPGPMSKATFILGIVLILGGCLLTANIFGTISNIFIQMNTKELKFHESRNQANSLMHNLKLDKGL